MPTATNSTATNPEIVVNAEAVLLNGVIVGLDRTTVEALVGFWGWPSVYSEMIAMVVTDGVPEVFEAVVMGPDVGVAEEETLIVVVDTTTEVDVGE